jgi:hypothetical protein
MGKVDIVDARMVSEEELEDENVLENGAGAS